MRPITLTTPVTQRLTEDDRRDIVRGIAIGAGVAVLTEVAKFALDEARGCLSRRREDPPAGREG